MLRGLRIFTICVFAIGLLAAFYFIPSDPVTCEPGDSPLYAVSLHKTTNQLSEKGDSNRSPDGKGGGEGSFATIEVTCGPTCNQSTCGTTCLETCDYTCSNTCEDATCNTSCIATCGATCANTCAQPTCESTCVVTCSYGCEDPISLISFRAEAGAGEVIIRWSTGSEIDNYCFIIWRSTNPNGDFTALVNMLSSGNCGSTTYYSYVDDAVESGVTYYYKLSDVSLYGYETMHPMVVSATPGAGLGIATDHHLVGNYPNPFNTQTIINFSLPTTVQTELVVFDVTGRMIRTLVDGVLTDGLHQVAFDAIDNSGNFLPSGIYIYILTAGELSASGKMIFMK